MRKWTQEEINEIIRLYTEEEYSIQYIAKNIIHCRASTISEILKQHNIFIRPPQKKRKFNKIQEQEIIDLYINKKYTQKILAEKYSTTTTTIHNILLRNNVKIIKQPTKNIYQDEHYFDNIDSEHKAYWLGFIFADGNVYGNQLAIEIHEKDIDLLRQFQKDLKLSNKISIRHRHNTSVCCIRMNSNHLCNTLAQYHIIPNKTKYANHLPQVPEYLIPHLLRGLIDGDGWITQDKQKGYHIGFLNNSKSVCEEFKRYCNIVTNNLCKGSVIKKDNSYCFQIQSKEATRQLATALYKDNSICLSRKYRLVEPLFDFKNDEDIV